MLKRCKVASRGPRDTQSFNKLLLLLPGRDRYWGQCGDKTKCPSLNRMGVDASDTGDEKEKKVPRPGGVSNRRCDWGQGLLPWEGQRGRWID